MISICIQYVLEWIHSIVHECDMWYELTIQNTKVYTFFSCFFVWNLHTSKAQNQIEIVWTEERVSSHTLTHAHPFIPNHLYQYLCTLEHIKTDSFFTVRWHHAFTGTHTHTLFQTPSPSLVASPCEWLRLHRLKRAQCFYAFNAQTDKICLKYHHTAACPKYLYYSTHIYIYVQIVSLFCWDCIYLSPQRTHHTTCCIEY